jgi:carboxyl-terminal processing protease
VPNTFHAQTLRTLGRRRWVGGRFRHVATAEPHCDFEMSMQMRTHALLALLASVAFAHVLGPPRPRIQWEFERRGLYLPAMSAFRKFGKYFVILGVFGASAGLALKLKGGGVWNGLAAASPAGARDKTNYELSQVRVVNEVLKTIRERYVDPKRVRPREMLMSALNFVQRDVAQIIVLHEENAPTVTVRIDTKEKSFRVDNVLGPWDVSARLREIFTFVQEGLKGTEVDLREVEYAACNGMLHTLDPHSVLLSPESFKDMNASTTGQFGGLGIVIGIRKKQLTVMNPMPGTPASRAGLKRNDRIQKINNESTLNMGLNEAVGHLRGTPGSKVTVWVHRDGAEGWPGVKPFDLVRETIKVKSVESKLLEGNVGYIRLKQFQSNSSNEMDAALTEFKKSGELKGLVLDLRGNPGGLLDQSARIVDKFVSEGPIVATVGNSSEGRDEKVAHADGTEANYPIVLLVSGTSASASEIVAGAMKNHDRAVIVGETTFGKGSVQLVFDNMPDKAALKLTIAQYLTEPGDVSIQGTGVTPDIELDPMTPDLLEMDLTTDTSNYLKERDLARSLSNASARQGQKPLETVRYFLSREDREDMRERGGELDDTFKPDFPIRFGRDLVSKLQPGKRSKQLETLKATVAEVRTMELGRASAALATLGVDWSDAPAEIAQQQAPSDVLDVKLETDRPGNTVNAGEPLTLKLTVTNKGTVPLHRLSAVTKSDNGMYSNKELVIGKLEPGKSRTVTAPLGWCEKEGEDGGVNAPKEAPRVCKVPRDVATRSDWVTIKFDEARGRVPAPAFMQLSTKALERPTFAYAYQVADSKKGNGDGRAQKGEGFTLYLTVKNVGKGKSLDTWANMRNLSGDGVLLHEGRFDLSSLAPGESKRVAFTFDVEPQLADTEAKVELSIADEALRESVVEKIKLPIATPVVVTAGNGTVHAKATGASLFEAPDNGARVFGRLAANTATTTLGTAGEYLKVGLGDGRFGFIKRVEVDDGGAAAASVAFEDVMSHMPPLIEMQAPVLSTKDATIKISGTVSDSNRLLDAYVFVGGKKVFYRSNRNGTDPKNMTLEAIVPLRPGINVIATVARQSPETVGRKVFVVRRDGANGEYVQTPRNDDEAAAGGDDE